MARFEANGVPGMTWKTRICKGLSVMAASAVSAAALAYDDGPRTVGCDYRLGKSEGTAQCLIVGSGMNQGITWVVFEVRGRRFSHTEGEDRIARVNKAGDTLATYPVTLSRGQCRPGGRAADIYAFGNGDRVCLYGPEGK
jgi:hypothetical protein